jgi:hypothetical protein
MIEQVEAEKNCRTDKGREENCRTVRRRSDLQNKEDVVRIDLFV